MTSFTNVSGELHAWLTRNGISADGVSIVLRFPTDEAAERAAFYVKREFELTSMRAADLQEPGYKQFKAHGLTFKIGKMPKID